MVDVALELLLGWDVRHIYALSTRRIFPTVIRAPKTVRLDSTKK